MERIRLHLKMEQRLAKGTAELVTLILSFVLCSGALVQAQEARIQGKILREAGGPLPQATLVLVGQEGIRRETVADAGGVYEFKFLPEDYYRLEVSADGYVSQIREKIQLAGGALIQVDFRLVLDNTTFREAEERGSEERNPNIFIRRVDLNAIRYPLLLRGIESVFLEFDAAKNQYGSDMGVPIRQMLFVQPKVPNRQFHMSFYGAHENSALNARPFFNVGPLRSSKRSRLGVGAGGSLISNKLFFTTNLDFVNGSGYVNGNIRVPLLSERTSTSSDAETAAIVEALLQAYPVEAPNLPNVAPRQLNTNSTRRVNGVDWNLRLDYLMSDQGNLAFQYTLFDYSEEPFELVTGGNPTTDLRPQTFSMTYARNWLGTALQSSFQFDRLAALLLSTESFQSLLEPVGLSTAPAISFGNSNLADLTSIGPGTQYPRQRFRNRFSGNSDVSYQQGDHLLRFGGRITRIQLNDLQSDNGRGTFSFTHNFGRTVVENFLKGTPTAFTIASGDLYRGFRNWENALYLQDQYQIQSGLTLNLGLRYEMVTAPKEVNNLTSFSYKNDNSFAPQLALSWAPGKGPMVVRAGYGISFGHIFPGAYQFARFNPPAVRTITIQNPSLVKPLEGVSMDAGDNQRSERSLLSADLVSNYSHQYNLVIQRRLPQDLFFEIGYIGHRTKKPFFPFVSNRARPVPGIPSTTETIDSRRPDANFLRVRTIINTGTFYYDALKVGLSRSLSNGLAFNFNYIFSKTLTNANDFVSTTNREIADTNSQTDGDIHNDLKRFSIFDHVNIFTVSYSYDLPFRSTNRILGNLFEGWKLSGVTDFRSGQWFGIETSSDAPGFGNVDGEGGDRVNITKPGLFGKTVDNPDTSTIILNPAFFNTNIEPGGAGKSPRKAFRGDRLLNTNLLLTKRFTFSGREEVIQLQTEIQNLFNHPFFARPGDVFPAGIFGKIVDTLNKGRVIQFMLRLSF